ncbi:uncharacterized protein LOC128162789 [Crassostrea angulata]|uniref:uncharacterized protein LOC128162789 n=1 Tax=Magallana angulata TaxID=2784310 RepID=UPI0022B10B86|nr:uncharacterized protein LOC128162789 [Crassostrea angulata]
MEGGDRSPVSFREPQVVNGGTNFCGGEGERRSNKPTEMTFSAKKPPRKKQSGGGRQCHNNIYGLLEDHIIRGSGRGRKEWCPKVRGEWGQRSSSLSPHLVRQHRTVRSAPSSAPTSAPTSPLTAHRRHGSFTDVDDRSSDSGDPYLNDLHGMSRPRAPRRHTVGGNDLMNEGGRGDNQDEVLDIVILSVFHAIKVRGRIVIRNWWCKLVAYIPLQVLVLGLRTAHF